MEDQLQAKIVTIHKEKILYFEQLPSEELINMAQLIIPSLNNLGKKITLQTKIITSFN